MLFFISNDMRSGNGLLLQGSNRLFSPQLSEKANNGIQEDDDQNRETFNRLIEQKGQPAAVISKTTMRLLN
jgi:hypothetical protein